MALTGIAKLFDSQEVSRFDKKAGVDIKTGLLMGYDSTTDRWTIAETDSSGTISEPLSVCYVQTPKNQYDAITNEGVDDADIKLKAGKWQKMIRRAVLEFSEGDFDLNEVGKPVWATTAGGITLTEPVTVGDLKKRVGYVSSQSTVYINLDLEVATIIA